MIGTLPPNTLPEGTNPASCAQEPTVSGQHLGRATRERNLIRPAGARAHRRQRRTERLVRALSAAPPSLGPGSCSAHRKGRGGHGRRRAGSAGPGGQAHSRLRAARRLVFSGVPAACAAQPAPRSRPPRHPAAAGRSAGGRPAGDRSFSPRARRRAPRACVITRRRSCGCVRRSSSRSSPDANGVPSMPILRRCWANPRQMRRASPSIEPFFD